MNLWKQFQASIVSISLVVSTAPLDGCKKSVTNPATNPDSGQATNQATSAAAPAVTYAVPTADQLYQLVAPIALFPDNLVALVLAGSTFPDQITAAENWLRQNGTLKGGQLQQAADQQPWDASVKTLTTFPDVLDQMSGNLTWTSALGDAYFNDQQNVMNAVQVMRQRAQAAGTLKSSPQQSVSVQAAAPPPPPPAQPDGGQPATTIVQPPPQTIVIQPAQPDVVYVPTYNPAVVYGAPVPVYPGYAAPPPPPGPSTGDVVAASLLSFGVGIAVGAAINSNNNCCGWGYNSWNTNWHGGNVSYNRNVYVSNSNTFVNRNNYYNNHNNYYNNNQNRPANYNGNNAAYNNRPGNYNRPANNQQANYNRAAQNRPNFNSNLNQQQFKGTTINQQGRPQPAAGSNNQQQIAGNRQPTAGAPAVQNNPRLNSANARPATSQPINANRQTQVGNRPAGNQQVRGAQNVQARTATPNPAQNNAARGYGQQPKPSADKGAFQNASSGGSARLDSSRGQQSLGVTKPSKPSGNSGNSGGIVRQPLDARNSARRRAEDSANEDHDLADGLFVLIQ